MIRRLVIIGAGGHGREVLDVVEAINSATAARQRGEPTLSSNRYEVIGFLDDGQPDERLLRPYGVRHIGSVSHLAALSEEVAYVLGIGDPAVRRRLDAQIGDRSAPVLVHPSATVGREVVLGPGTIVCPQVSMTNHIRVGRHVHLNRNSTVGHDADLGNYVTLSPLVAISGNVTVGEGAFLGTGSMVNPRVTVGAGAVVGTGAAVIRDVEARTTVVGVPAKPR